MEKADLDENKSENINSNIEEDNNSYDISEEKEKIEKVKSKKIAIGSSTLHFLPIKLKDDKECQRKPVDENFEKFIEVSKDDNYKDYDTTLFRGRILNGKKINIEGNDNFKINYVSLNKENENDDYKIGINRKVNDFYVWKYDSSIEDDNNLINFEKNMKKLDILSI